MSLIKELLMDCRSCGKSMVGGAVVQADGAALQVCQDCLDLLNHYDNEPQDVGSCAYCRKKGDPQLYYDPDRDAYYHRACHNEMDEKMRERLPQGVHFLGQPQTCWACGAWSNGVVSIGGLFAPPSLAYVCVGCMKRIAVALDVRETGSG